MIEFISSKRFLLLLALLMSVVVVISNYLVQYPFEYLGLDEILTYGAFTYPVAFLITDLANRKYGKFIAKKIVYLGFFLGAILTFSLSTNFSNFISIRIAIGSGIAFITAQLIDVAIFDKLRKRKWFVAPLTSSLVGSTVDTFIFFSIAFYGTSINWFTLGIGDLCVKIIVAVFMLIPFRMLIKKIDDFSASNLLYD